MGILYQRTRSGHWLAFASTAVISGCAGLVLGLSIGRQQAPVAPVPATQLTAADASTSSDATQPGRSLQGAAPATTAVPDGTLAASSGAAPTSESGWRALQAMNPDELVRRVQRDSKFAAAMLAQMMQNGSDPELREFLAVTLAQARPALLERSAESLLRSPDLKARREAFELLSSLPDPPRAVAAAARQAVLTEGSPEVVAQALAALRDAGGLDPLHTDEAVLQQLRQYVGSTDPQLRRESVATLVLADRSSSVEPILRQAVSDTDPSVQIAAIGATVDAGIRSAEAKAQLLELSFNPQADPQVRAEAMSALQSFRLTTDEAARLAPLQQQQVAATR